MWDQCMARTYSGDIDKMREMQKLLARFMEDGEKIQNSPSFCMKHSDIEEEEALRLELSKMSRHLIMYS